MTPWPITEADIGTDEFGTNKALVSLTNPPLIVAAAAGPVIEVVGRIAMAPMAADAAKNQNNQ